MVKRDNPASFSHKSNNPSDQFVFLTKGLFSIFFFKNLLVLQVKKGTAIGVLFVLISQ